VTINGTEVIASSGAWKGSVAGLQGPQGIQGPTGQTGAQGIQGIQGPKGDTGAQGIQGPTGQTGAQGAQGIQGQIGAQGIQGIQGAQGPSGVVNMVNTAGQVGTVPNSDFGFIGPTASVFVSGTQSITATVSAVLGTTVSTAYVNFDVCYRLGSGAVVNFNGGNWLTVVANTTTKTFTASASVVPGTAGTYTVGFCAYDDGNFVYSDGGPPVDNNDYLNGWVMVTN
jgi:hypothetical protein